MRAATPATILVLAACIVLVLVTCSTPVIKSLAFLEATIGGSGSQKGQKATLGCLGYCIGDTCQGPTIGYTFDPTQLLGVATSVEGYSVDSSKYTSAVIKGLTYTLVLNPIALALCVVTLLTGLMAHCGDCALVCINGVFSGLASGVALIAVALNFALFILAQKRINQINGANATLGTALWLSLAGWILIVLSSCAFCCGCGGRGEGRKKRKSMRDEPGEDAWKAPSQSGFGTAGRHQNTYGEQMRMDALRAESDRKRQTKDLPKFATFETEHVEALPLKHDYDDSFATTSIARHGTRYDAGYNQDQYAYAYGDESSYGHAGTAGTYVAGVGPGARRGAPQPAVSNYYDSAPNSANNLAGHGAHQVASPAATEPHQDHYAGAMNTPMGMTGAQEGDYFYADTAQHQSTAGTDRDAYDGYASNDYGASHYPGRPSSAYLHEEENVPYHTGDTDPGASQHYGASYGAHGQADARTLSAVNGHPLDHSGATFGGEGGRYGQSSTTHASQPYDAVRQATSAGAHSRQLPVLPSSHQEGEAEEIVYSPDSQQTHHRGTSFNVGSVPPPRTKTGDDGFGVAVLEAGAAAAATTPSPYQDPTQGGYRGQQNRDDDDHQYYLSHNTHSPNDDPPGYGAGAASYAHQPYNYKG